MRPISGLHAAIKAVDHTTPQCGLVVNTVTSRSPNCKPATATAVKPKPSSVTIEPIVAELVGDDSCSALGIEAHDPSPVLAFCRKWVDAGHDPSARLEVYRNGTLALCVRLIGEAAGMRVATHGVGFEAASGCTGAPPAAKSDTGRPRHPLGEAHGRSAPTLSIETVIAPDLPTGEPQPPVGDNDAIWQIARRADAKRCGAEFPPLPLPTGAGGGRSITRAIME